MTIISPHVLPPKGLENMTAAEIYASECGVIQNKDPIEPFFTDEERQFIIKTAANLHKLRAEAENAFTLLSQPEPPTDLTINVNDKEFNVTLHQFAEVDPPAGLLLNSISEMECLILDTGSRAEEAYIATLDTEDKIVEECQRILNSYTQEQFEADTSYNKPFYSSTHTHVIAAEFHGDPLRNDEDYQISHAIFTLQSHIKCLDGAILNLFFDEQPIIDKRHTKQHQFMKRIYREISKRLATLELPAEETPYKKRYSQPQYSPFTDEDYHAGDDDEDPGQLTFFNIKEERAKRAKERTQERKAAAMAAKEKAIEAGAIMSIGEHLAYCTAETLKKSLSPDAFYRLNTGNAENADKRKSVFDERGKANKKAMEDIGIDEVFNINSAFLGAILQASILHLEKDKNTKIIPIYVPEFIRQLGIDPRPSPAKKIITTEDGGRITLKAKRQEEAGGLAEQRLNAILKILNEFDNIIGKLDGNYYRLMGFYDYDSSTQTIHIIAPYIIALRDRAIAKNEEEEAKHSPFNQLMLSTAATEPPAAQQIATQIINGILSRGTKQQTTKGIEKEVKWTTDKKSGTTTKTVTTFTPEQQSQAGVIVYRTSFRTLVEGCKPLKAELDGILNNEEYKKKGWTTARYNRRLEDVFKVVYRILLEKSELPNRLTDFTLPTTYKTNKKTGDKKQVYLIPTKSTLDQMLTITYTGRKKK